jgi:anti-sigma factor RsiW
MMAKSNSFNDNSDFSKENDRFELLSAYMDGELTVAQKEQVQQWLNEDPNFQQLYQRLLKLNEGFQSLPAPVRSRSPQQITDAVFEKVDQHRWRKWAFWSGTAIAAVGIGLLSLLLPEQNNPIPQLAENSSPTENTEAIASKEISDPSLMIAVNRPVVPIPKAVVAPNQQKDQEK